MEVVEDLPERFCMSLCDSFNFVGPPLAVISRRKPTIAAAQEN